MKTLTKIWKFLNGNKTIITGLIWGFFQTSIARRNIPPETLEILRWGFGGLAALSGVDHARKGFFTTKVGNVGQITKVPEAFKNTNVQK